MDGNIGSQFLENWCLTLNLACGGAWLAPASFDIPHFRLPMWPATSAAFEPCDADGLPICHLQCPHQPLSAL